MTVAASLPSHSINQAPRSHPLVGGTPRPVEVRQQSGTTVSVVDKSFGQKVFDALVELKVAVAQFAMHLSVDERRNIFSQLDNIINVEDWYEEDQFPSARAFKDLLAWSIYAEVPQWHSLGVDDDGNVLIAWHTDELTLTANFDGNRLVRWTSRYHSKGDVVAHASGECSLRQFAKQAKFYLEGLDE